MIKFYGELSQKCKNYILQRYKLINTLGSLFAVVIFGLPMLALALKTTSHAEYFYSAFGISLIFPIFSLFVPTKKMLINIMPQQISVVGDTIISIGKTFRDSRSIAEIKKVVDYGEWYHIFFNIGHRSQNFICQKNLIKEGSLQDFENLFCEKIIIKNKL